MHELGIPFTEEGVFYKGEVIPINYSGDHSIENIVTNWLFREKLEEMETGFESSKFIKIAKPKARAYRHCSHYLSAVKFQALKALNLQFGAEILEIDALNGFDIESINESNGLSRNLEEIFEMDIHAMDLERHDLASVLEKDIEDYLIHNLSEIEPCLKFVERQSTVEEARLDIWARDITGRDVIIEIKTSEDKDLLWQAKHYPEAFGKKHGGTRARMIVIAPKYGPSLLKLLKEIPGIEIYKYLPTIRLGKVVSVKVVLIFKN